MPPPAALAGLPIGSNRNPESIAGPSGLHNRNRSTGDSTTNPTGDQNNPIGGRNDPIGDSNDPIGDSNDPIGDTRTPIGEGNPLVGTVLGPSGLSSSASIAATLANLLPVAGTQLGNSSEGVYVGDGRPPVPTKLAQKIRHWEFMDMGELLPEFSHRNDDAAAKRLWTAKKPRQVTNIFTWMQCFTTYVSVLGPAYPDSIPELMAYAATIIRVSQDFSGLAWQHYDSRFRRQAALTGNRQWSRINATLYTTCFTGKALAIARCELCFASTHTTSECGLQGDADPELPKRIKKLSNQLSWHLQVVREKRVGLFEVPLNRVACGIIPNVPTRDVSINTYAADAGETTKLSSVPIIIATRASKLVGTPPYNEEASIENS